MPNENITLIGVHDQFGVCSWVKKNITKEPMSNIKKVNTDLTYITGVIIDKMPITMVWGSVALYPCPPKVPSPWFAWKAYAKPRLRFNNKLNSGCKLSQPEKNEEKGKLVTKTIRNTPSNRTRWILSTLLLESLAESGEVLCSGNSLADTCWSFDFRLLKIKQLAITYSSVLTFLSHFCKFFCKTSHCL